MHHMKDLSLEMPTFIAAIDCFFTQGRLIGAAKSENRRVLAGPTRPWQGLMLKQLLLLIVSCCLRAIVKKRLRLFPATVLNRLQYTIK